MNRTFAAAALAAALSALAPAPAAAQVAKGVIRVGTDVDAFTLDPRLMRDTTAFRVADLLFDGLVTLDAKLTPQPNLAEKWENPEPTVWVFYLRPNATFHDGSPVTAEDVVYTLDTIRDPALNSRFRGLFTPIKTATAVDAKTVRLELAHPYAPLMSYLDIGIVPKKVAEAAKDGFGAKPVGSGPMKLVRWDKGARIVLAPHEGHWAGKAKVAEIQFVVVPDNTARAQAFEAGDLDLIQSPLSPRDVKRLAANPKFANKLETGLGVTYLNFNTSDPVVGDPKVRRAIAAAVDQATIVNQIYEGIDKPATSVLLPSFTAYSAAIKQPGFDLEAAKKALSEAGWVPGAGGVRAKDGKRLALTLSTHTEDPNRIQTVEYLQNLLGQIGVEAKIQTTDWPTFFGAVTKSQHQVALLGWLNIVDPDRLIFEQLRTGGGVNYGKYFNPELDKVLAESRSGAGAARDKAYQTAAEIVAKELPYYVISYQGYQVFYDPALKGFSPDPRGMLRSLTK